GGASPGDHRSGTERQDQPLPPFQVPTQPRALLDGEDQALDVLPGLRQHEAEDEQQEAEGRGRRPAFIDPLPEAGTDRPDQERSQHEQQRQAVRARRRAMHRPRTRTYTQRARSQETTPNQESKSAKHSQLAPAADRSLPLGPQQQALEQGRTANSRTPHALSLSDP